MERVEPIVERTCRNAKEVEENARLYFYTILNTQRLIAVVGSGVAASYGYPGWKTLCQEVVKSALQSTKDGATRKQLKRYQRELEGEAKPATLTSALDYCGFVLKDKFHSRIKKVLKKSRTKHTNGDDLVDVIRNELGIRRFVTLNFDNSMGTYLNNKGFKGEWLSLKSSQGEYARVLTLEEGGFAELVEMGSGNYRYKNDVLHLHGHVDVPGSLVAGEADYKKRYLSSEIGHSGYRDGLDYLLSSNPIIFLGIGLNEEDPLRPLREHIAREPDNRSRPVFAVMPDMGDRRQAQIDLFNNYLRFGIYTILYDGQPSKDGVKKALRSLLKQQARWWKTWQKLPRPRKPKATDKRTLALPSGIKKQNTKYQFSTRHAVLIDRLEEAHDVIKRHLEKIKVNRRNQVPESTQEYLTAYNFKALERALRQLYKGKKTYPSWTPIADPEHFIHALDSLRDLDVLRSGGRYRAVVCGERGIGKGELVNSLLLFLPLMQRIRLDNGLRAYDSVYFVNASVSQEFSSVVETIAQWIHDSRVGTVSRRVETRDKEDERIGKLRRALGQEHDKKLLLVFSNAGRLFRKGEPINPLIYALFNELTSSTIDLDFIVLTSGAEGAEYVKNLAPSNIVKVDLEETEFLHASRLSYFKHNQAFVTEVQKPLKEIFRHVDKHTYCTEILCSLVRDGLKANKVKRISNVTSTLATPVARAYLVTQIIRLRLANKKKALRHACGRMLKTLALVGSPVTKEVLRLCTHGQKQLEAALLELTTEGLIIPIAARDGHRTRYALHRLVRRTILSNIATVSDEEGEFSFFGTSLYGIEPEDNPKLDFASYEDLRATLDLLLSGASGQSELVRSECARAASGILEGFFSTAVLSRMQSRGDVAESERPYNSQVNTLRDVFDVARNIKGKRTSRPFYQHELVWLLNERGVILLTQGRLYEAVPCLRQARDHAKGYFVKYWIDINYAYAAIERGHLVRAREVLIEVMKGCRLYENVSGTNVQTGYRDGNPYWLAHGWLGLVSHLQGKHTDAAQHYKEAIENLELLDRPRAVALLSRHYGDLLRSSSRDRPNARIVLLQGRAAAERSGSVDLMHRMSLADAQYQREEGQELDSLEHDVQRIRNYGENMGLYSLVTDCSTFLCEVALQRQRTGLARVYAQEAVTLATRYGMKLRKLSSQLLLARIQLELNEIDAARSIATTVRDQSQMYGYQLVMSRSEQMLLRM